MSMLSPGVNSSRPRYYLIMEHKSEGAVIAPLKDIRLPPLSFFALFPIRSSVPAVRVPMGMKKKKIINEFTTDENERVHGRAPVSCLCVAV